MDDPGVNDYSVSLDTQEVIVKGTIPYEDVYAKIQKTGKEVRRLSPTTGWLPILFPLDHQWQDGRVAKRLPERGRAELRLRLTHTCLYRHIYRCPRFYPR